jgi:hypothetical protein
MRSGRIANLCASRNYRANGRGPWRRHDDLDDREADQAWLIVVPDHENGKSLEIPIR